MASIESAPLGWSIEARLREEPLDGHLRGRGHRDRPDELPRERGDRREVGNHGHGCDAADVEARRALDGRPGWGRVRDAHVAVLDTHRRAGTDRAAAERPVGIADVDDRPVRFTVPWAG